MLVELDLILDVAPLSMLALFIPCLTVLFFEEDAMRGENKREKDTPKHSNFAILYTSF